MPVIEAEESWRDGEAEGAVVGGCLSIVAAMAGTPWALETRGRLLFLEDVNEHPYRIERCLLQLHQAGVLGAVSRKYAHKIPFIVKINHNELLTYPNKADQIMFGEVEQAADMGAAAVGAACCTWPRSTSSIFGTDTSTETRRS